MQWQAKEANPFSDHNNQSDNSLSQQNTWWHLDGQELNSSKFLIRVQFSDVHLISSSSHVFLLSLLATKPHISFLTSTIKRSLKWNINRWNKRESTYMVQPTLLHPPSQMPSSSLASLLWYLTSPSCSSHVRHSIYYHILNVSGTILSKSITLLIITTTCIIAMTHCSDSKIMFMYFLPCPPPHAATEPHLQNHIIHSIYNRSLPKVIQYYCWLCNKIWPNKYLASV